MVEVVPFWAVTACLETQLCHETRPLANYL
jgi:hypothetical protein